MQVRQSSQSDKKTDCASPPTFPEGPTPIQLGFLSRLPGQLYRSINLRILVVLYWTSYRPTDVQLSVCLCFSCRFERLSSTSGQHNLGLNSAWKRAQDRSKWRKLVETAICPAKDAPPDDDDDDDDDMCRLQISFRDTFFCNFCLCASVSCKFARVV